MMQYIVLAIVIILVLTVFYGYYNFYDGVEKEKELFFKNEGKTEQIISAKDLEGLPQIMKNYMQKVGALGKCKDCPVIFKQSGRIKTGPEKKWTDFTAAQYMTAKHPGFIWSARAYPLFIRDKSIRGKGEVKVSLFGIKDLALFDGPKTDVSALGRSLGELMFYPIGFLSEDISWEATNGNSVKAIATLNGVVSEGIFYFDTHGLLERFESKRYMGQILEDFTGKAENYKMMGGLYIPANMKAIWNLKDGDFEYFNCTITDYRTQ